MYRHASLKKKTLRDNQAPFLTKELRKEIYTRSKSNNKYNRNPTEENKVIYKKQKNKCVSLRQKVIKVYFNNVMKRGAQTNKYFWKLIKPFLTNKGFFEAEEIMLTEKDKIVTEVEELVGIFNDHYINIIECSSENKTNHRCKKNKKLKTTKKQWK